MKKLAVGAIFATSLFRLGGGAVLVKSAVAAVIPEPDRIPSTRPAFAMSSRIDWPLAPSETTALKASECAAAWISISPPTENPIAADPVGVDVGATLEIGGRSVQVAVAAPAEDVRVALARALSAAVEEEDAVAVLHEHARVLLRPGAAGESDHRRAVASRG